MKWCLFALCFVYSLHVFPQYQPDFAQRATIQETLDAYNIQDYRAMKKTWGFLGRVIVTKKGLSRNFTSFYKKYGQAEIDTISCSSIYQCTALLHLEKDESRRSYLNFVFNDKAKLQGFGFGYPIYIYPKRDKYREEYSVIQKQAKSDSAMMAFTKPDLVRKFSGCVGIRQNGTTIYSRCEGYADPAANHPLNDSTQFLLASVSKQFTAVAIMILAEKGLLDIEDEVRTYIKNFPYDGIKVKHLLTHTSGLPDYMVLLKKHWDKTKIATDKDVVELISKYRPNILFDPGERFEYCNTGYVVLSYLIEKVSGLSYGEFLASNVFEPLGMTHTRVVSRRQQNAILKNYAVGTVFSAKDQKYLLPDSTKQYAHVSYMDGITGDDGVSSSISDMGIWNEMLVHHPPVSMQEVWQKATLNNGEAIHYGYGFFLEKDEKTENLVYHTGSWPGYITMSMIFPEREISIVVLSNNYDENAIIMADRLAAIMLK